jgi:hypothetical protein
VKRALLASPIEPPRDQTEDEDGDEGGPAEIRGQVSGGGEDVELVVEALGGECSGPEAVGVDAERVDLTEADGPDAREVLDP